MRSLSLTAATGVGLEPLRQTRADRLFRRQHGQSGERRQASQHQGKALVVCGGVGLGVEVWVWKCGFLGVEMWVSGVEVWVWNLGVEMWVSGCGNVGVWVWRCECMYEYVWLGGWDNLEMWVSGFGSVSVCMSMCWWVGQSGNVGVGVEV